MFRKIGDALSRFMSGRYGTDSLKEMEAECRQIIDGLSRAAA